MYLYYEYIRTAAVNTGCLCQQQDIRSLDDDFFFPSVFCVLVRRSVDTMFTHCSCTGTEHGAAPPLTLIKPRRMEKATNITNTYILL